MTISHFLHLLALFTFVSTNVTIFFYAFPAYKRSRRLAFLLLVISCGLGTFINVWDWTVIQTSRTSNPNQYYWFYCIREVFYVICAVCGGVASFLLIRALDPHTVPAYASGSSRAGAPEREGATEGGMPSLRHGMGIDGGGSYATHVYLCGLRQYNLSARRVGREIIERRFRLG